MIVKIKKPLLVIVLLFTFTVACYNTPLRAQTDKVNPVEKEQSAVASLINQLKFDEAETLCKKIIKKQPENIKTFTDLCTIYTKTGRFDLALFTIEEMKDLKADANLISLLTGKIYLAQGKFGLAVSEFDKITNKDPQYYYGALNNLGIAYKKLGNSIKSKGYFDLAAAIKPSGQNPVSILINESASDINNNDFPAAQNKLSKALEQDSYNIDGYYNMAVLNYLTKNYDLSLKNLYKIADYKVFYPYADYLIGKNLIMLDRTDEAQVYLTKSIEDYPPLFEAYPEIANLNIKNGNYGKAQIYLEDAAKLETSVNKTNSLHILYGNLYFRQGKIKEAINSFDKASKDNPDIYYNMAVCYQLLNDNKTAVKYYNEYLKSNLKNKKEVENIIKRLEK